MKHKNCLLLNADYTPLCIIGWKKSITLDLYQSCSVDTLEYYKLDVVQCANNITLKVPAVMLLKKYVNIHKQKVHFSRKNLFIRDDFKCQYCMKKLPAEKLTYDHVIPKSLWREKKIACTQWNNVVTCCRNCNLKKGNKKLDTIGMKLNQQPYQPKNNHKYLFVNYFINRHIATVPKEWRYYL